MEKQKKFRTADFFITAGTISFFSTMFFVANINNFGIYGVVGSMISIVATIYLIISATTYNEGNLSKINYYSKKLSILDNMKDSGQLTEEEYNIKRKEIMEQKW